MTYIWTFIFYQLTKLFHYQLTGMIQSEWFGNNDYSCDRCFFHSQKGDICWFFFEWPLNICSLYNIMLVKSWIIWKDKVSDFIWKFFEDLIGLHNFLPSISLSYIFQHLLGILLQVWSSTPSNLPISSNLSFFDNVFHHDKNLIHMSGSFYLFHSILLLW